MHQVFDTHDGSSSVFSETFGATYHSRYGAVQESRHVFIEAGLCFIASEKKEIRLLEMGFGSGLNAFLTLLEAEKLRLQVAYAAVEAYPLPVETYQRLNFPDYLHASHAASHFEEMHRLPAGGSVSLTPHFLFEKIKATFETVLLPPAFDLIYFDAFAPDTQPALWDTPMMRKMYEALTPGGLLVTYCAKGDFKRALKAAGFRVEALPGPPGKREMTRGVRGIGN